jgi:hypothetical protein
MTSTGRRIMLRAIGLCAVLLASASAAQEVPEIRFDAVDFLKPPAEIHLGEVAGVALGKAGQVYVFQRGSTKGPAYAAAAAQLLEFDSSGGYVREIGHYLYAWSYAHATRVDAGGNIWVADKGSNMVVKFAPSGRVAMVFGRKPEDSDENARPLEHPKPPLPAVDGQFREVTDMAWDSEGNTHISDGYIIRASPRLHPMAAGWAHGAASAARPASSTRVIRSRSMRGTKSMSPTVGTDEFRCSTPPAPFCGSSRSTSLCPPTRRWRSATARSCHLPAPAPQPTRR